MGLLRREVDNTEHGRRSAHSIRAYSEWLADELIVLPAATITTGDHR
jgi:hypothetical protein